MLVPTPCVLPRCDLRLPTAHRDDVGLCITGADAEGHCCSSIAACMNTNLPCLSIWRSSFSDAANPPSMSAEASTSERHLRARAPHSIFGTS